LYRTSAFDPLTFTVAARLMFIVALAASTWSALRAPRTDPNKALRSE
jgi:ABC-type lipoprotein release transport system permease subunit